MPGMYVRYAGRPPAPDELQATHIMKDTSEPGFCVTDGGGGRSGHYILTRSRLWIKRSYWDICQTAHLDGEYHHFFAGLKPNMRLLTL